MAAKIKPVKWKWDRHEAKAVYAVLDVFRDQLYEDWAEVIDMDDFESAKEKLRNALNEQAAQWNPGVAARLKAQKAKAKNGKKARR